MCTWILQVKFLEDGSGSGLLAQVLQAGLGEHGLVTVGFRWDLWSTGVQRCSCLMRSVTSRCAS